MVGATFGSLCNLPETSGKMGAGCTFGRLGSFRSAPGVNEDVRDGPNEEFDMTDRQLRLHEAGLWLFRCAALIGGVLGLFIFATTLTAQQRLVFLVLVGAIAMPVVLVGLALAHAGGQQETDSSAPVAQRRPSLLNALCLAGAAFLNALLFVSPDAFGALALVAVSGAVLAVGVRVSGPSRPAGQLP